MRKTWLGWAATEITCYRHSRSVFSLCNELLPRAIQSSPVQSIPVDGRELTVSPLSSAQLSSALQDERPTLLPSPASCTPSSTGRAGCESYRLSTRLWSLDFLTSCLQQSSSCLFPPPGPLAQSGIHPLNHLQPGLLHSLTLSHCVDHSFTVTRSNTPRPGRRCESMVL